MRRFLCVVIASVAVSACVSVNKSMLDSSFERQPLPPEEVQVFFADDELPEHTRVAILHASGDSGMTDEAKMIDRLREEAGKVGANAIVLDDLREPSSGERAVNALFTGYAGGTRRGEALAIHVHEG